MADTGVVEPETILPTVIEQSWQRKLAVFSGSLQHVRRGVLFALYPDNRQLGRRLADLALRVMADPRARPASNRCAQFAAPSACASLPIWI